MEEENNEHIFKPCCYCTSQGFVVLGIRLKGIIAHEINARLFMLTQGLKTGRLRKTMSNSIETAPQDIQLFHS